MADTSISFLNSLVYTFRYFFQHPKAIFKFALKNVFYQVVFGLAALLGVSLTLLLAYLFSESSFKSIAGLWSQIQALAAYASAYLILLLFALYSLQHPIKLVIAKAIYNKDVYAIKNPKIDIFTDCFYFFIQYLKVFSPLIFAALSLILVFNVFDLALYWNFQSIATVLTLFLLFVVYLGIRYWVYPATYKSSKQKNLNLPEYESKQVFNFGTQLQLLVYSFGIDAFIGLMIYLLGSYAYQEASELLYLFSALLIFLFYDSVKSFMIVILADLKDRGTKNLHSKAWLSLVSIMLLVLFFALNIYFGVINVIKDSQNTYYEYEASIAESFEIEESADTAAAPLAVETSPSPEEIYQQELNLMLDKVNKKIQQAWEPPIVKKFQKDKEARTITCIFSIDMQTGEVLGMPRIIKSSKHKSIDKSVRKAIYKSEPFNKYLPKEPKREELTVQVDLDYSAFLLKH